MPSVAQSVGLALVRRGAGVVYERHRPETTTLYEVVRDNLETLYGAVDEGALPIGLPAFVRRELDGYPRERQLEKPVVRQLATCRWVQEHQTVIVTGPTGTGKSYLSCALAHQACREGHRVFYRRVPRLFDELRLARADVMRCARRAVASGLRCFRCGSMQTTGMRPFRRWLVIATATASATACGFHSLGGGPGDAGASGNAGDGSSTIVDAGIDATHANDATHAKDAVAARDTGVVGARDTGAVGAQDTGLAGQPDTGVVSQPDAGVVGQPDTGVVSDGAAAEFCATVTGTAGCSGCACASCTSTMNECAADTDCVALLSCYQASGCSDVLTCFQAGGPCAATYGAHSGGATKGEALSTCLQGSCLAACTVGAEPDAAAPPFDGGTSPACGATVGDAGACTSCACQSCPAQSNACFANADCAALDRCFQAYACLDPVSCFSGPCASTYEAHSGGQSAALNLYSCERTAGCSHACALAQPAADAGGPCGDIGEPCCPGAEPECNTGLACRSDSAGSVCGCGQEGEPCCPNDVCLGPSGSDERAQCFNGTCGHCYTTGATICTLPPCIGSGLCCDGCSLDTINGCSFAVTCN